MNLFINLNVKCQHFTKNNGKKCYKTVRNHHFNNLSRHSEFISERHPRPRQAKDHETSTSIITPYLGPNKGRNSGGRQIKKYRSYTVLFIIRTWYCCSQRRRRRRRRSRKRISQGGCLINTSAALSHASCLTPMKENIHWPETSSTSRGCFK